MVQHLRHRVPYVIWTWNPSAGRVSRCGVLECVADEGLIYLPCWVCFFLFDLLKLLWFSWCFASYLVLPFVFFTARWWKTCSYKRETYVVQVKNASLAKEHIWIEAAAPHQGLLRYLQPQSYVSQFAIFISTLATALFCVRTCYSSLVSYLNVHLQVGKISSFTGSWLWKAFDTISFISFFSHT
jgi:hypothetical protein